MSKIGSKHNEIDTDLTKALFNLLYRFLRYIISIPAVKKNLVEISARLLTEMFVIIISAMLDAIFSDKPSVTAPRRRASVSNKI